MRVRSHRSAPAPRRNICTSLGWPRSMCQRSTRVESTHPISDVGAASATSRCRNDAFERCIVLTGMSAHCNERVRDNLIFGKDSRSRDAEGAQGTHDTSGSPAQKTSQKTSLPADDDSRSGLAACCCQKCGSAEVALIRIGSFYMVEHRPPVVESEHDAPCPGSGSLASACWGTVPVW